MSVPQNILKYFPILSIVIANLIPIFGVLYWGWDLSVLLFLYWLESFVVGGVNVFHILTSNGPGRERIRTTLFFILHYGGFWIGHGVFLFALLMPEIAKYTAADQGGLVNSAQTVRYALWGFAISHAVSFLVYIFTHSRSERLPPVAQMFTPYGRVFVMHIVILGGAYLAAEYANILGVLLLFVGLKIFFELGASAIGRSWRKSLKSGGISS